MSWIFLNFTMGSSRKVMNEWWMPDLWTHMEHFCFLPGGSVSWAFCFQLCSLPGLQKRSSNSDPLCLWSADFIDLWREIFIWKFSGFSRQEQWEMGPSLSWLSQQKESLRQKMNLDLAAAIRGEINRTSSTASDPCKLVSPGMEWQSTAHFIFVFLT